LAEKICILKGGISPEREISLKSGEAVEKGLREVGYKTFSLDTRREDFFNRLVKEKPDVVFIALHGPYGEDGTVQGVLELLGIPYTGSGVLSSALAMDKVGSKRIFASYDIPFPQFQVLEKRRKSRIKPELSLPLIIKPVRGGSTLGVSLAKDKAEIEKALEKAFCYDSSCVIVEEYIQGREVTVGIIEDPEPRALPIIEILPKRELYDYKAKYTDGFCEFITPAPLKKSDYLKAEKMALRAYQALGCRDFARVDMIIREGKIYLLEVNTIPGMTEKSLLPRAARAEGISFPELMDKIVKSALKRKLKFPVTNYPAKNEI